MAEDNQNPTNPTPPPTGDGITTPPPVAEENPVENKVVDEPAVEPTAEPVEAEPTPEAVEDEVKAVKPEAEEATAEPIVASTPEPTVEEKSEETKITETSQPVTETPTEEAVEPEAEVVEAKATEVSNEKIVDSNQTIEEVEQQPEAEENIELIQGDIPKPGDKIESEEIPQTEAIEEVVEDPTKTLTPPPPIDETLKTGFKEDGITPLDAEEKLFSAIGYISFLALLPFLTRKDSEFAQHHGQQGLAIFIIIFIFTLLFSFSGTMRTLSAILTLSVAIGGGLMAYKGDWFKIPGIYDLSLKLKSKTPPTPTPPTVEDPPASEEENQQQ
jgi:uncharacterized membrane protein